MPETAITIITSYCIPEKPSYLEDCLMETMWVKTCHLSKNIHFISFLGKKKKNHRKFNNTSSSKQTTFFLFFSFFLENVFILINWVGTT